MKINSNMAATYTIANLNKANNSASQVMKRLSSGLKITSAKDNPAALAIANKLHAQVQGLSQANRNAMDGISLVQTAEGALNEVSDMLTRLKELATQGLNGTYSSASKEAINAEITALTDEIKNIQNTTTFNKFNIFNSSEDIMLQIGANAHQTMVMESDKVNLDGLVQSLEGLNTDTPNIEAKVDQAIHNTSTIRSYLGAYQNRLEHTTANLGVSEENTTASLSRIEDADMAEEMTNYTQYNILSQSGIAILAQANQRPQQVLQLLNS